MLTEADLVRYKRQILYPGFGEEGQRKLREAHVVVAGVGGLGCTSAMYLAYAGIGHITIVDSDRVELSNLNRQVLHWDRDVGQRKTASAAAKLGQMNPTVRVTAVCERITADSAGRIICGADVVVDGMDNFEARFALNAACVAEEVPFVHAGVHGFLGEVTTIIPGKTPCLACMLPGIRRKQSDIPVFGVGPGIMAMFQVAETIKLLAGFGILLAGRMLYLDIEKGEFGSAEFTRRPDCRVCGGANQGGS